MGAIAVVTLFLGWLLWPVLTILLAASALAYLLDPVVDRFEVRGRTREAGILTLFAGAAGILLVLLVVIVPSVVNQIADLSGNIGTYLSALAAFLDPYRAWAEQQTGLVLPFNLSEIGQEIPHWLKKLSPDAQETLKTFLGTALSSGLGFVVKLLNLALLPIFTFYLLRDWDRIIAWITGHIPVRYLESTRRIASEIDERMANFVRGQIMVASILASFYAIGLWAVARIDLPILIGCAAGFLYIVPYVGPAVGLTLASILALLKYGLDWHILAVLGVFGGGQLLENFVLTPRIVGDKVGLHPLVVMIALIAGGDLLGFWGMLLAIPITAALSVLLRTLVKRYQGSAFFSEDGG